jgi:hypothetical protein
VTVTPQNLGAWALRLLGLVGVVLGAIPQDAVPANVRPWLVTAGALWLAVDRYVTDPTTGTPAPPVTPPSG